MDCDLGIFGLALIVYVGSVWVKLWLWRRENGDKP